MKQYEDELARKRMLAEHELQRQVRAAGAGGKGHVWALGGPCTCGSPCLVAAGCVKGAGTISGLWMPRPSRPSPPPAARVRSAMQSS